MSQDKNEIRLSGTMTAIVVLDEEINGVNYSANVVDQNIESVGGNLQWNDGDGYESESACKWNNIGLDMGGTLDNGYAPIGGDGGGGAEWPHDDVAPVGTLPAMIRAIGIKYNSKVGVPGLLEVAVKGTTEIITLCSLNPGEGIALPLNGEDGDGFANDKILLKQTNNDATNYAKVTIALLGHDGV
tara:strand:- start:1037 stop:1594 length:558 start_codon:yes stop_codon:yes gene_type:complete